MEAAFTYKNKKQVILAPTCRGRGCVGVGAQHCPFGLHALWGLRAAGVVGGRPRGRWPATGVRGFWCQALSLPWPPVLCKNHVVWLNARHQGTSKQGNEVELQSLFTHIIGNAFLTFRGAP